MSLRNPLTRSLQLLAIAIACTSSVTNLRAQEAALPEAPTGPVWNASADSPFEAFLAKLNSPIYAERHEATQQLATVREGLRLSLRPALRNMFDAFVLQSAGRADLSPEQRARLARPIRDKFFSKPRAAMGINIQAAQSLGIPVIPQAGFPCADESRLKPGDYLAEIDGVSLENRLPNLRMRNDVTLRLRFAILSHEPGEVVPVLVRRPVPRADGRPGGEFQTFRMNIPLGAWDQLGQPPVDRTSLQGAWEHYKRKLGITATTAEPSLLIPSHTSNAQWEANRMHPGMAVPPSMTIGSAHAGAIETYFDDVGYANMLRQPGQSKQLVGPNGRVRPGAQLRANQPRALPTREQIRMQQISQQLSHKRTLQKNLANVNALIAKSNSRLELPELLPQERRSIEINLKKFTAQVETYESLIRQLNISLARLGVANQAPVKAPKK